MIDTLIKFMNAYAAYRYSVLIFVVMLLLLTLWRHEPWGEKLVDHLNHVTTNVWAVLLISWGVLLSVKGHDNAATPLLTGGFALLRGPGTPKTNGVSMATVTSSVLPATTPTPPSKPEGGAV